MRYFFWLMVFWIGTLSVFADEPITPSNADQLIQRAIFDISSPVVDVTYSPDERYLLVSRLTGFDVWDMATFAQVYSIETHQRLLGAFFSPDGARIITVLETGTPIVWDAVTGERLYQWAGDDDVTWFNSASYVSDDAVWLVTTTEEGLLLIWDGLTETLVHQLQGMTGPNYGLQFSPDGKYLLSKGMFERVLNVWHVETGEHEKQFELSDFYSASIGFTPSGEQIFSALLENNLTRNLTIWELATDEIILDYSYSKGFAFHPDGERVFKIMDWHGIDSWNFIQRQYHVMLERQADLWIDKLIFSPDGALLVVVGALPDEAPIIRIFSTVGDDLLTLTGFDAPIRTVIFNADGSQMIVRLDNGVQVWEIPPQ